MASTAVKMAATDSLSVYKSLGSTVSLTTARSSSTDNSSSSSTSSTLRSAITSLKSTSISSSSKSSSHINMAVTSNRMNDYRKVIETCNKFDFAANKASLFRFFVLNHDKHVGYMLPEFIQQMNWNVDGFKINKDKKTVLLDPATKAGETMEQACQMAFVNLCELNVGNVKGLDNWVRLQKNNGDPEYHPVLGLPPNLGWLKVPSPLRGVFGIVTAGAHMTMFTIKPKEGTKVSGVFVWVSKRSQKVTYAGKLDQLVAGAMGPDDNHNPLKALSREAMEEAGLEMNIATGDVMSHGRHIGKVDKCDRISFYDKKSAVAGTEQGQLEPGIRYTYMLNVPDDYVPKPCEPDSIDGFHLLSLADVEKSLKEDQWKPNCALAMLSFLRKECFGGDEAVAMKNALQPELPFEGI